MFKALKLIGAVILASCILSVPATAATITDTKPGVPFSLRIPDTDIDIDGCVSPGALVTFLEGIVTIGSTTSQPNGQYTQQFFSQTPGIKTYQAYYEDSNGRVSSPASETIALLPKSLSAITLNPSPTINYSPTVVEQGASIAFTGQGCPNSTVTILIDNNFTITARVDPNGNWSTSLNTINFSIGSHAFTLSGSGPGYSSQTSQKYLFEVTNPAVPLASTPVPTGQGVLLTAVTDPKNNFVSSSQELTLTGDGPPNTQIEVYADGRLIGSTFTNSLGVWTLRVYLSQSETVITTRACTDDGCGQLSEPVTYFLALDTKACAVDLRLKQYRFNNIRSSTGIDLDLMLEGAERHRVKIDWGDITVDNFTADQKEVEVHHVYKNVGNYNGYVMAEANDCYEIVYFSVAVDDVKPGSNWLVYIVGGLLLASIGVLYARSAKD